jgi:hypothetical protein
MHGAVRVPAALLLSLAVLPFASGCASKGDVTIEERSDLTGACTWDFLSPRSRSVHAPHSDAHALDASLARLLERGLLERGLARATDRPDLFVTYFLEVERRVVIVSETPAVEHLASLHHTPSYDIQATETRKEVHETGKLTVLVSDSADQAIAWRGTFEESFKGEVAPRLEDAVARLLERLPAPHGGRGEGVERAARSRALLAGQCGSRSERARAPATAPPAAPPRPQAPLPRP